MPPCTPVKPTPAARKYLSMTSWQREMHGFFNSSRKLALERNCSHERIFHRSRGTHSASGQSALSRSMEDSLMRRSEEHTSELQSPDHLVCRLLLEKKNSLVELIT